ncbi:tRNA pseudouridine(13) synthase TruD [Candidatus Aenigmatarchaeota archaeon]
MTDAIDTDTGTDTRERDYITDLPHITPDLKGTGGKIREKNEYFQVEEIPLYEPSGSGNHLYVNVTREGITTRDLQERFAEVFNVKPDKVGCAGMKDKNAKVTQTFSVEVGKTEEDMMDDFLEETMEKIAQALPVTVNWVRMHNNKLRVGHLIGNRFTIRITGLQMEPIVALERARVIADKIRVIGLPNFYGPQRFGFRGENVSKGLDIILNKYRLDDKWLRRLLVSSYQSYLCNRYLAKRIEKGFFGKILKGDIAKKHETGGLFEVQDPIIEQPRYERNEISFTAPIYGSDMKPVTGEAADLEAEVLRDAGMTMDQLNKAGANGTRRPGRIFPKDINIGKDPDYPESLTVTFTLPKGGFATTFLREIMKVPV